MNLVDTLRKREKSYRNQLQGSKVVNNMVGSSKTPVEDASNREELEAGPSRKIRKSQSSKRHNNKVTNRQLPKLDDSDLMEFQKRVRRYHRSELLNQQLAIEHGEVVEKPNDHALDGGLRVPGDVWSRLYDYQREGVTWLWKLHQSGNGGILGDEMGLGKTIQVF